MKRRPCTCKNQNRHFAHPLQHSVSSIRTLLCLLCVMTLSVGGVATAGADSGHRQDESEKHAPGFQSGVLTANMGKVLEINGKRYQVDEDVAVTDDDGNKQDPAIMRAGDELQFYVKKGKIKRIIWIMPR